MENLEVVMKKEMYVAAMRGKVEFLESQSWSDEYLNLKTSSERNNILHIATRYERQKFIKAILEKIPHKEELICEKNSKGNTPLHVAAQVGNYDIVCLLFGYLKNESFEGDGRADKKPWMVQNMEGNTAVHVAIMHDNVKIAMFLLDEDFDFACVVNESKEAPLHLAIKQHVDYSETDLMVERIRQPIDKGGAALAMAIDIVGEEKIPKMIELLVEKASYVASWPDTEGLTPLHRAASLSSPYNVQIIQSIIENWPQSAEVCDYSGKSILHHLVNKIPKYKEVRRVLKLQEIYTLRNHQDLLGNTPLHMAARSRDINMVRVLLESSTKLNINNREGVSATSIIQQQNVVQLLRQRRMTKEESENAERANITWLKKNMGLDLLLAQDSKGRNIVHKLMNIKNGSRIVRDNYVNFIKEVLEIFPALLSQKDHDGNTPVHILVQIDKGINIQIGSQDHSNSGQITSDDFHQSPLLLWKSDLLKELLDICCECINNSLSKEISEDAQANKVWSVQNSRGNTPLHEAIIANNNLLVHQLLDQDKKPARLVNKNKETPLHLLAASQGNLERSEYDYIIEIIVKAYEEAPYLQDKNGLTPILRAVKEGEAVNLYKTEKLCTLSPRAAEICDEKGKTVWHLLFRQLSAYSAYRFVHNKHLREVLKQRDFEGNTPLHQAIVDKRFDMVHSIVEVLLSKRKLLPKKEDTDESSEDTGKLLLDLLEIPNRAGSTPGDLIAESECLPKTLENILLTDPRLRGIRSSWRISTKQLQSYMNSMNVIAALQTTITFTAAFTVPGGLIQDIGYPILIRSIAFQIFFISDVIAMCLSMMVLICLLWMMATDKRQSIMIQDFTVSLLLASFVATLITFMMGVFATIYPVKRWIAIATLVLCSLLMLLIHRFMVTKLLLPFKYATVNFFHMLWDVVAKFCFKTIKKLRSDDDSHFDHYNRSR